MGFVSPLVSPARKLTPHPPSLFSPFSRETVPAQSSTDFLTHTLRLYQIMECPLRCGGLSERLTLALVNKKDVPHALPSVFVGDFTVTPLP
jgi:hypothetical protein